MNFNECTEVPNRYAGSDRKKTILIDNNRYLLKFPDPTRKKVRNISYINNAFSEYVGCKIFESVGVPVQSVLLGTYTEQSGKVKIACACKDFCDEGFELYEVENLLLSNTDSGSTDRTDLDCILSFIDSNGDLSSALKERFYDTFVLDCIICNADRHNGNWGLLINSETGEKRIAPVYDCGSALSPLIPDKLLDDATAKNNVLNTKSAIMIDGKRIWSSDYIKSGINSDLNNAVDRIYARFDLEKVKSIIDNTPYLSEKRKDFYKSIVSYGYNLVLLPAHNRQSKLETNHNRASALAPIREAASLSMRLSISKDLANKRNADIDTSLNATKETSL